MARKKNLTKNTNRQPKATAGKSPKNLASGKKFTKKTLPGASVTRKVKKVFTTAEMKEKKVYDKQKKILSEAKEWLLNVLNKDEDLDDDEDATRLLHGFDGQADMNPANSDDEDDEEEDQKPAAKKNNDEKKTTYGRSLPDDEYSCEDPGEMGPEDEEEGSYDGDNNDNENNSDSSDDENDDDNGNSGESGDDGEE